MKMKGLAAWSSQRKPLGKIVITAAVALCISIAMVLIMPVAKPGSLENLTSKAYAASGDALAAGSAALDMDTASSGFRASTYYLNLSPKIKKVPYGHKYIPVHKTVTIKIPDGYYPVTWESSNPKVATAKDSYKTREMKLTVYGNAPGKSTITIWNDATYETIKIRVVVKGYNSKDFKASKTKLNLSSKKKKVAGGYKYSVKSQTITVAAPDQAENVYWKSSDYSIADAKWSGKWNGNTTKLTIRGHRPGKATITLTNTKTKKKIKIKVTVNGYGVGIAWKSPVKKRYTKADGSTGYYAVNNFKLINKTGETLKIDKKCALRIWALNPNYDEEYNDWLYSDDEYAEEPSKYSYENSPAKIRGVPLTVKNGKSKVVYVGENDYLEGSEVDIDGIVDKVALTIKVGNSYKTIYADGYGMVTKVLNGRKI